MLGRCWAFLSKRFNALVAGLILIFGVGIVYRHQKRRVATAQDLLDIERAQNELIRLRMEREALGQRADTKREELAWVDVQIEDRKKQIVAIHEDVQGLAPAQVAEAFARLGY